MKTIIKNFIISNYLPGEKPENLTDDTPLIRSGILDSLAVMTLILFCEKEFKVEFSATDTLPSNIDTINHLVKAIKRKQGR